MAVLMSPLHLFPLIFKQFAVQGVNSESIEEAKTVSFDVSMAISIIVSCCPSVSGVFVACAKNTAAIVI